MKPLLLFVTALSFIASCTSKESVNGTWESIGCGWILQIKDSTEYTFYDETSLSCLPSQQGDLSDLKTSLSLKNDTLSLLKGVITYRFIRAQQLPKLCCKDIPENKKGDPVYNFEVFAETVKEHYVFMDLNHINWPELLAQQKSKLSNSSSNADLYLTIEETLGKLNDNHAYIEASDAVAESIEKLSAEKEASSGDISLPEYGDFQVADKVVENHLVENMTKDSWLINWGKLTNDIGYIQVKAMWLYADLNIPKDLIDELGFVDAYVEIFNKMYEGEYIEKEVQAVSKIMDNVMSDLSDMKSIVIDVRFNGGGQDAVSFEILRRFIPQKLQVATEKLRAGNGFSPTLSLYIQGTDKAYTKPVYVLTSQQSSSAAESFAIATLSMKNVKRIGSATDGAISTALEKTLPNGWAFSISNEVFMDNQGKSYENTGIPVDFELNYPDDRQTFFRSVVDNLPGDKNNILKAIDALNNE